MKKYLSILFAALLLLPLFISCKVRKMDTSDRINIVCSIFPEYDWVRNILGDDDTATTLTLLEKNGMDLHSYQPAETDINIIKNCDLIVYTGGKSDEWIKETLNSAEKDIKAINLIEILKEKTADEQDEYDEHVWLSIKNAVFFCKYFTDTICQLAPESAERYQTKMESYLKKLEAMDFSFRGITETSANKTLIICDKFPFKNLLADYGLNYYAAFADCSKETDSEPTTETISLLAEKLNEVNSNAVIVLENNDKKIDKAVIGKAKKPTCDTFIMESMQYVTLRQAFEGKSYISLMQKNLETIQKALK